MPEPILRADDLAAWDVWQRAAAVHARTQAFARRVDGAKRVVDAVLGSGSAYVGWSGGKDSTCLAHLVTRGMGATSVDLVSEKDDIDFPGEDVYVRSLAGAWGARLRVIYPPVSPAELIMSEARAGRLCAGDDIHGRAAAVSKVCFYAVMEEATRRYAVSMLGLRAEESGRRAVARAARGLVYRLATGQVRANPLGDWRGLDVYAYVVSRGVELLPVYRCLGLMHANEPWRLRKSWWLPGSASAQGQVVWLRRYYPSLYRKLAEWIPGATLLG